MFRTRHHSCPALVQLSSNCTIRHARPEAAPVPKDVQGEAEELALQQSGGSEGRFATAGNHFRYRFGREHFLRRGSRIGGGQRTEGQDEADARDMGYEFALERTDGKDIYCILIQD